MLAGKGEVLGDGPTPEPVFCVTGTTSTVLGLNPVIGSIVFLLFLRLKTYRFCNKRSRLRSFC